MKALIKEFWASWNAALMFYTCLPIPQGWPLAFSNIARRVPGVGIVVGGVLAAADGALSALQFPGTVSSVIVVAVGILLTGGLHLDGVMDTADGLAVPDRSRRLAVMVDSHMGAFGGMAAVVLLLIKVISLSALVHHRAFILVAVAVWGRWGQQWAIARYPYLKKEGKGAFHKAALPSVANTLPSLFWICLASVGMGWVGGVPVEVVASTTIGGILLALITSAYFNQQLGGHTGDTYGAVVEWTEALLLCSLTAGT